MAANVNNPVNLPSRNAALPAANNSPASNAASNAPTSNAPDTPQGTDAPAAKTGSNQIMGFFEGFVKEGVDTVGGLYTLVTTNPITTAKGLVYMAAHPVKAFGAITEPYTTAYREGNYGELAGRLSFQALTFVVTSGALKGGGDVPPVPTPPSPNGVAKAAEAGAKGAQVAAVASNAEEAGIQKAIDAMIAKHPKLTADALKDIVANGKGSVVYRNEFNALAARYTAEAGGVSAEALDGMMKAAGHLPKTDVYQFVRAAAGSGMSEGDISANLAKFAGTQGGKDALRAATSKMAADTAASTAAAASAAEAKTLGQATGQAIDEAVTGVKNAGEAVRGVGKSIGQAYENTADGLRKGAQAVRGVYDASFTLGDVAHGVAAVPMAIGRGVGKAYQATIGRLIDGIANIRLVNPFHTPNWEALSKVQIRPLHILAAPVTVPLGVAKGAVSLAIHNPVRFMGVAALTGDVANAAKMGQLLASQPADPAVDGSFRLYELKEGDSLESIAQKELGDASRWKEIYAANKDLFDSLGSDGTIASGTKIKIPTGNGTVEPTSNAPAANAPANNKPAANTPAANNKPIDAKAYKDAVIKLITDQEVGADADTKQVLEAVKAKLSAMSPEDVLALKPQLEEQGIKVDAPAANAPAANAPANNKPAANTPAANAPANAPTPANNKPAAPAGPTTYTASKGDSLWSIAQSQLGDATKWRDLIALNKDKYPTLESNPDFIGIGWQLQIPAKAAAAAAPAPKPASVANSNSAANNQAAAPVAPEKRAAVVKDMNLQNTDGNWNNFVNEIRSYPNTVIGPDFGSDDDRKAVQTLLNKLGYPVQATGSWAAGSADNNGNTVSPTAQAIIDFKKKAGITQSYNVMGANGKATPAVNEYVDDRTRETMQVTLRLLQDPGVRSRANMNAAVQEAAKLQDSSIGPEVGSREGRVLVQQYLGALGYPNVKPTGEFDQASIDALVDFKKKHNLAASYKNDQGQPVYLPYVDGATAEALYQGASTLTAKG